MKAKEMWLDFWLVVQDFPRKIKEAVKNFLLFLIIQIVGNAIWYYLELKNFFSRRWHIIK